MVHLLWCVCGGLLLHMLESNYLTMLVKPTYGKPVDSKQDILDRGLGVIQEWCVYETDGTLDDLVDIEYEQLWLCADVIILL